MTFCCWYCFCCFWQLKAWNIWGGEKETEDVCLGVLVLSFLRGIFLWFPVFLFLSNRRLSKYEAKWILTVSVSWKFLIIAVHIFYYCPVKPQKNSLRFCVGRKGQYVFVFCIGICSFSLFRRGLFVGQLCPLSGEISAVY